MADAVVEDYPNEIRRTFIGLNAFESRWKSLGLADLDRRALELAAERPRVPPVWLGVDSMTPPDDLAAALRTRIERFRPDGDYPSNFEEGWQEIAAEARRWFLERLPGRVELALHLEQQNYRLSPAECLELATAALALIRRRLGGDEERT